MEGSMSFKAYLKRDGQDVEVRRFAVDGGAGTSYMYLCEKLQAMFPSIHNEQYKLFWQDNDKDYIIIGSDEELLEALTSSQQPLKMYIQMFSDGSQGNRSGQQAQHPGVICDGCEGQVVGFRYKCSTCSDFDLCASCESAGLHAEHFMIRIPTPISNFGTCGYPKFRKMRGHKFHKRHGWTRMTEGMCGDAQGGASRCPFARRGENVAAAVGGVANMFDFSALMEFINSLGVGPERGANEASATAQTVPNAQPNQAAEPPGTSQQHTVPQASGNPSAEYLNNIGQAISSFLDPFGVDVSFEVRTKSKNPADVNTPAATSQATPSASQTSSLSSQATPSAPQTSSLSSQATPSVPLVPLTIAPDAPPSSTSSQTDLTVTNTATETQTEPTREQTPIITRRNSDDWTILNRESPTRSEMVAMDVDESHGVKPKSPTELPKDVPSAPPSSDNGQDSERQRVQQAIELFRAMGFNFDTAILRDLLQTQNCNIASVLETILGSSN